MNNFTYISLGVVKSEIIESIRYETQGRASYHVLFKQGRGSHRPLRDRVALDPADGDPDVDTRFDHLIRLVLIGATEYLGGHATRFFHARRRGALQVHTLECPVGHFH